MTEKSQPVVALPVNKWQGQNLNPEQSALRAHSLSLREITQVLGNDRGSFLQHPHSALFFVPGKHIHHLLGGSLSKYEQTVSRKFSWRDIFMIKRTLAPCFYELQRKVTVPS